MTKKELLDNKWFQVIPENTEIVFCTDKEIEGCVSLNASDLTFVKQANGKMALVIDALSRTYLERMGMFIMPK